MRRDQGLTEALGRVANARPLGLDVEALLLELRGHVVEGARELRELVASADLDPLAEVPARDRVSRVGESAQRPTTDLPSRYVIAPIRISELTSARRCRAPSLRAPASIADWGESATNESPCGSENGKVASPR